MIALTVTTNLGRTPWTDLRGVQVQAMGKVARVGRLPGGTQGGKSTVTLLITMPDGQQVLETTLALFTSAARALQAADSAESN